MRKAKASVVWELLDMEGAQRLVVDVDAPLRPFGADPTPPQGIALPPSPPPLPATEALLRALRNKSRRE